MDFVTALADPREHWEEFLEIVYLEATTDAVPMLVKKKLRADLLEEWREALVVGYQRTELAMKELQAWFDDLSARNRKTDGGAWYAANHDYRQRKYDIARDRTKIGTQLRATKAMLKERNVARFGNHSGNESAKLRKAIVIHRNGMVAADMEPTEHDLRLWASIGLSA